MKTTAFLLFIALSFTLNKLHAQKDTSIKIMRINPDYAQGGTVSQLFDSVIYIPLETTKESVFGDIQSLQVSKLYFAFFDFSTKAVFVFDKKGKFIGKIKKAPDLNNSWELNNFVLNPYTEHIYLAYNTWDRYKIKGINKLAIFKPNGQLIKSEPLDTTIFNSVLLAGFSFLDSTTMLFANNLNDTSSKSYFVSIQDFNKKIKEIMPITKADPFIGINRSYHRNSSQDGKAFWSRGHDYTFIASRGDQLQPYKILLPKNISLDPSFYKDSSLIKGGNAVNEYNKTHTKTVTGLRQLFACVPLQFFTLIKGNSSSIMDSYFYNLDNGHLFGFSKISPDSTNGYLPIMTVSPAVADNNYIYSTVAAYELFNAKESAAEKHPIYSTVMQQFFATQNRKSNSVLVVLKPKKNL